MKLKEKPEDFIVKELPGFSLTPNGRYYIYRVKKRLRNTEGVAQEIDSKLKVPRKNIGYAGAKDRQAVTEQYFSISGARREKVENLDIKGVDIEFIGRSDSPISLGDHSGNEFEIIARECEQSPKSKEKFVNFFGEQRFSHNNDDVGKAIVKKEWGRACELVMEAGGRSAEKIRIHLESEPNDFLGALRKLPFKLVTFYIHAYQSRLWNKVAEEFNYRKDNTQIPIIGFATEFADEGVEEAYRDLMKEEGISLRDFVIRQWPELTSEGGDRHLYAVLKDLRIEKIDEETYRLNFFLPKGAYATVAIEQLFSS